MTFTTFFNTIEKCITRKPLSFNKQNYMTKQKDFLKNEEQKKREKIIDNNICKC